MLSNRKQIVGLDTQRLSQAADDAPRRVRICPALEVADGSLVDPDLCRELLLSQPAGLPTAPQYIRHGGTFTEKADSVSTEKSDYRPEPPQLAGTQEITVASDIPDKQTVRVFHVGDAIRKRRKTAGLTLDQLAEQAGVARSTLFDLESEGSGYRDNTLRKVAAALSTTPAELLREVTAAHLGGRGTEGRAVGGDAEVLEDDTYDGYERDAIPVVSDAEASSEGTVFWTEDGVNPALIEDRTSKPYKLPFKSAYAVRVRGDSMSPVFRPGMELIVAPTVPVRDGDEVFVVLRTGERLIKYATRADGGWMLVSANPAYPPRFAHAEDVEVMHAVVHSKRR